MKIIDCKQGETAWHLARAGKATASEFDQLVTPLWKVKTGETPEKYVYSKVAEKVMGYAPESASTFAMGQGSLLEHEAIPMFEGVYDVKVTRVGFVESDCGFFGCSPDGLIGDEGGVECKCPEPHTHLANLLGGVCPAKHLPQVQGCMYVTGRPWWWFISYNRHFPPLVVKVYSDPIAQRAIGQALNAFVSEFLAAHAKLMGMIQQPGRA